MSRVNFWPSYTYLHTHVHTHSILHMAILLNIHTSRNPMATIIHFKVNPRLETFHHLSYNQRSVTAGQGRGQKESGMAPALSLAPRTCGACRAEVQLRLPGPREEEWLRVRARGRKWAEGSKRRTPPGRQASGTWGNRAGPGKAPGSYGKGKISTPSP